MGTNKVMIASVIEFPKQRARSAGTLHPDRRELAMKLAHSLFSHARHADTGLPVSEEKREEMVQKFFDAIEEARIELERTK